MYSIVFLLSLQSHKTTTKKKKMKTIKKVKSTLIGIDKFNNIFLLDGNGVWQQQNNKQIIKLF